MSSLQRLASLPPSSLVTSLALLVLLAACATEPEEGVPVSHEVVEGFAWDQHAMDGPVIGGGATDNCRLSPTALLDADLGAVAAALGENITVSAGEPVRLSDENLATAVDLYLHNLWTVRIDETGSLALSQGMPSALPELNADYVGIWKELRDAGICGASVVTWSFPSGPITTLAWIINYTTFHEPLTDNSLLPEPPSLNGARSDRPCGSASWVAMSLGDALDVSAGVEVTLRYGICADLTPVPEEDLICTDPTPTVEASVPLGRFDCGELETLVHRDCCGARMACTLTVGFEGFSHSITKTPVAITCPHREGELPPPEECTEW